MLFTLLFLDPSPFLICVVVTFLHNSRWRFAFPVFIPHVTLLRLLPYRSIRSSRSSFHHRSDLFRYGACHHTFPLPGLFYVRSLFSLRIRVLPHPHRSHTPHIPSTTFITLLHSLPVSHTAPHPATAHLRLRFATFVPLRFIAYRYITVRCCHSLLISLRSTLCHYCRLLPFVAPFDLVDCAVYAITLRLLILR